MILVLNNRDSFVFNISRYFEELGEETLTVDSQTARLPDLRNMSFKSIVISPGPGTPAQAGISSAVISEYAGVLPILGVCLGHQVIASFFGWKVQKAKNPKHGEACEISHSGKGLFSGLNNPIKVGLYHSLIAVDNQKRPLIVDARSPSGEVMALRHESLPIYGVQFHPESILTEGGYDMLGAFLNCGKVGNAA